MGIEVVFLVWSKGGWVSLLDSLPLDMRVWTCPECGAVHDRDLNAAKNIHAVGLTVFEACGEAVRPGRAKARLGKLR